MKKFGLFSLTTVICFLVAVVVGWDVGMAQKECDIAVVEKRNRGDNIFVNLAWNELAALGTMVMVQAEDLIDIQLNVKEEFNNNACTCINSLWIVGHGKEGKIAVGDGQHKNTLYGHINGNENQWKAVFAHIKPLFCATAEVLLVGCNTGACDKGRDKLYKLAQELGVTVSAPVDKPEYRRGMYDLFPYTRGGIIDYKNNGRWQAASPIIRPPHQAAKKDQKAGKGKNTRKSKLLSL